MAATPDPLYVCFWGVRGSLPTPGYQTRVYGGNTACVEVRCGDTLVILDAGTGLRSLGLDLMRRGPGPLVGHMLFSHMHWDHIQGFPFFTPIYIPANAFYVYSPQPGPNRFHQLLSGQMQSEYFPVSFADLGATITPATLGAAPIGALTVRCIEQPHPGGSWGYRLERQGRAVVYATDSELDQRLLDAAEATARPQALRRLPAPLVDFARQAELLIADGQYDDAEYPKKVGWGHARAYTAVDLAVQAGVKRLALTHHDPLDSDEKVEAKIEACRRRVAAHGARVQVFAAREGIELKL